MALQDLMQSEEALEERVERYDTVEGQGLATQIALQKQKGRVFSVRRQMGDGWGSYLNKLIEDATSRRGADTDQTLGMLTLKFALKTHMKEHVGDVCIIGDPTSMRSKVITKIRLCS